MYVFSTPVTQNLLQNFYQMLITQHALGLRRSLTLLQGTCATTLVCIWVLSCSTIKLYFAVLIFAFVVSSRFIYHLYIVVYFFLTHTVFLLTVVVVNFEGGLSISGRIDVEMTVIMMCVGTTYIAQFCFILYRRKNTLIVYGL